MTTVTRSLFIVFLKPAILRVLVAFFFSSLNLSGQNYSIVGYADTVLWMAGPSGLHHTVELDSVTVNGSTRVLHFGEEIEGKDPNDCMNPWGGGILSRMVIETPTDYRFCYSEDTLKILRRNSLDTARAQLNDQQIEVWYVQTVYDTVHNALMDSIDVYQLEVEAPPWSSSSYSTTFSVAKYSGIQTFANSLKLVSSPMIYFSEGPCVRTARGIMPNHAFHDYQVGDILHYEYHHIDVNPNYNTLTLRNFEITSKSVAGDSVLYQLTQKTYGTPGTINTTIITKAYPYDNLPVGLPTYHRIDLPPAPLSFNVYFDKGGIGGGYRRYMINRPYGPYFGDSCYVEGLDPHGSWSIWDEKVGLVESLSYWLDSGSSESDRIKLVYFKSGTLEYGSPHYLGAEEFNKQLVSVYPNPAGSDLRINSLRNIPPSEVIFYNLQGVAVQALKVGPDGTVQFTLPNGCYSLEVRLINGSSSFHRLLVNK